MSRTLFRQRDLTSVGSFAVGAETLEHLGDGVHACTMHVVDEVRARLGRWLEEIGSEQKAPDPLPAPAAEEPAKTEETKTEPAKVEETKAEPAKAEAPGEQSPKKK